MKFKNEAIPKHTTSTTDVAWDSGENVKRISNDEGEDTMRMMYAWVDPDKDLDTKAAYKFPHHMVSTAGKVEAANIKACQSIIAILNGSRGGADIPDMDRQGVYDHVAKHLNDAGEKPAELQNSLNKKFWQFKNTADPNTTELLLYGEIQSERPWFDWGDGGGVYADEFAQDLQTIGDVSQITCRINSVGGDIFAAVAIYTQLKMHSAKVVCVVDGLAASAATLILMAADEIQMPTGAMIMIHDPLAGLMGLYKADELLKQANTLNTIKESIVSIYAERTGASKDTINDLMSEETWMGVDLAVQLGFADKKISAQIKPEMKGKVLYMNGILHDLSGMKNIPELEHAKNIADAITAANAGNPFLTQFVAMAGKKNESDESKPDDPDNDGDAGGDNDDDGDGKNKKNSKKNTAKKNEDDEEINDDDADQDGETAEEDKKAKKSVKNLMNKYPKLCNLIIKNAKAEERQRIQEIDAIAAKVKPELLNDAKYKTIMSAKDLAFAQMKASSEASAFSASNYLADFAAATQQSGVKNVGSDPSRFQEQTPEQNRSAIGEAIAGFANNILKKGRK